MRLIPSSRLNISRKLVRVRCYNFSRVGCISCTPMDPMDPLRRSRLPQLVTIVILSALAACGQSSQTTKPSPEGRAPRAQLSIGYSLLYQEADGIPKLDWLIRFKRKTSEMEHATDDLITFYKRLADTMRQLSKEFPGMRIDVAATSEIEGDTRKAIGKDLAKDLFPVTGKAGIDFEREALLNFYDALNEQRHLVRVMVPLERDPTLKNFLETTEAELDARYERVGALLSSRYFTH